MAEEVTREVVTPQRAGSTDRGVKRVVAALDGSGQEAGVLAVATALAVRRSLPLDLVHVVDPGFSITPYDLLLGADPSFVHRLERSSRARLDEYAQTVRRDHPELRVETRTPWGPPSATLVARSEDAVVVVGAPTRDRVERVLLGSTAQTVVAHARGTVLVVPGDSPPVEPRHVVVGVDGSAPSARAVDYAVDEAARVGGRVTVVTAWTVEVEDGVVVTEPGTPRWQRVEDRLRRDAEPCLAGARAAHPQVPVDVVVRNRPPAAALLEVADDAGADLVVVGSRGRGGFVGLMLGSVSRAVAQRSDRPVAVVR